MKIMNSTINIAIRTGILMNEMLSVLDRLRFLARTAAGPRVTYGNGGQQMWRMQPLQPAVTARRVGL